MSKTTFKAGKVTSFAPAAISCAVPNLEPETLSPVYTQLRALLSERFGRFVDGVKVVPRLIPRPDADSCALPTEYHVAKLATGGFLVSIMPDLLWANIVSELATIKDEPHK